MSTFRTAIPKTPPLDPNKRLRYALGMVLGKDDLDQEQAFFLARDRLHNRALHGYGTVCGLEVAVEGLQIQVSPGMALSPSGDVIRVTPTQCADLQEWLRALMAKDNAPETPPDHVHVVLCYRECETDAVPMPGIPCRTEDETAVPSRIASSFELTLMLEEERQEELDAAEDAAVSRLADLLRRVEPVGTVPGGADELTVAGMIERVRAIPDGEGNGGSGPLYVLTEKLDAVLDAAFRTWVTAARPETVSDGEPASAGGPNESCVLLARVNFAVEDSGADPDAIRIEDGTIDIDDTARPYLLHTDLIQESLLGLARPASISDHGELSGLLDDDHHQYLLVSESDEPAKRGLLHDLPGNGNGVRNIAAAEDDADAVRLDQVIPKNAEAGGDLRGELLEPEVIGLLGRPIDTGTLQSGRYLRFEDGEWVLGEVEGGGGGTSWKKSLPFATVHVRGNRQYDVWFNLHAPMNRVAVDAESLRQATTLFIEQPDGPELIELEFGIDRIQRNVFRFGIAQDQVPAGSRCLRFRFDLTVKMLNDSESEQPYPAMQHMRDEKVLFSGFAPEIPESPDQPGVLPSVTVFVYDAGLVQG